MGKKESERPRKSVKEKKKKKRKSSSSVNNSEDSASTSSSDVSLSSIDEETKKKLKSKLKKLIKKEKKKKKKKKELKKLKNSLLKPEAVCSASPLVGPSSSQAQIEKSKSLAPMTKAEWEKLQNTFKHVYDEETGRMRLVKGTGEIVEECVSRERHLAINKQATRGDGEYFQRKLSQQLI